MGFRVQTLLLMPKTKPAVIYGTEVSLTMLLRVRLGRFAGRGSRDVSILTTHPDRSRL